MAKLISFTVRQRGRDKLIKDLPDAKAMAETLLQRQFEGDAELIRVAKMITDAIAGHQTPTTAFNAFAQFAYARGLVVPKDKSAAWEEFARAIGLRD